MITVQRKKLLEVFSNQLRIPAELTTGLPAGYFSHRHLLNRFTLVALITLPPLVFSGFSRLTIVFTISVVVFLAITYFRTKKIAESLSLIREAPKTSYEKSSFTVKYEIRNQSSFEITNLVFLDLFTGSNDPSDVVVADVPIRKRSTFKFSRKRVCDGGMGEHIFGPMKVKLTDPLGFFYFYITEDEGAMTKVLPLIQPIPELPVHGSTSSTSYGIYDVPERGMSVNFLSLREYKPGDPLKQISWRLSLKHATPLIKEFEKVVNTQITLLLDFDPNYHTGEGSESTWEWVKDIALSIASQQVTYGNDIQVITQDQFIPFGRGDEHVQFLALQLMNMKPQQAVPKQTLVERYLEFIPRGSTVFYIGPAFTIDLPATLEALPRLRANNIDVYCVLLDGASFTLGKLYGSILHATGTMWTLPRLKANLMFLVKAEVPVYLVQMQKKFARALARKVA
ncbi:MAG: DUF58 domain-containing protein [Bdellovibrionia bacterium]